MGDRWRGVKGVGLCCYFVRGKYCYRRNRLYIMRFRGFDAVGKTSCVGIWNPNKLVDSKKKEDRRGWIGGIVAMAHELKQSVFFGRLCGWVYCVGCFTCKGERAETEVSFGGEKRWR